MKIRTDFVTNSSSSMFVVKLSAKLSDGVSLALETGECGGDYDSLWVSFNSFDQNNASVFSGSAEKPKYEGDELCDLEFFGPRRICFDNIINAKSAEDLFEAIRGPFLGWSCLQESDYDVEDIEYESDLERLRCMIVDFNRMYNAYDGIMTSLKSVDDVCELVVTYEFGGRGDELASPEEIIEKIFGRENGGEINQAIIGNDEEKAVRIISKMDCLSHADEESIRGIISFVNDCKFCPDNCIVTVHISKDRSLHYSIEYRGEDYPGEDDLEDDEDDDFPNGVFDASELMKKNLAAAGRDASEDALANMSVYEAYAALFGNFDDEDE